MKTKILAISNILGYIAVVVVNYLAVTLPIGGKTTGELADLYPNLFVPAGLTFSIRGLIYLLLLGFVVWQAIDLYKKHTQGITKKVGLRFLLSCLANIGWIFAWHYQQVFLSVVIMILFLLILIVSSYKVSIGQKLGTWGDKLWVQIPFSVYLAWICVATIANISTLLVTIHWNMRGLTDIARTIIVILVATGLGLGSLYKHYNVPFALVVIWAFVGILIKRTAVDPVYASSIIRVLYICIALLTGGIGYRMHKWLKN